MTDPLFKNINTIPGPEKEEARCLKFLKSHHPEKAAHFSENCTYGRKGILSKLADSVLRENIDGIYETADVIEKHEEGLFINGNPFLWPGKYKSLATIPFKDDYKYKLVHKDGYGVLFPIKKESAFQLVETDPPLWIDDGEFREISSAAELVYWLFRIEDYKNRDRFIEELNNGTVNLTLAYVFHEEWKKNIQREAQQHGVSNSYDYVQQKRKADFSPSLFFEQMVLEGHHLHPGAKTKLGLSYDDVLRYSPEFHQTFPVRFAAVKRDSLSVTEKTFENYFSPVAEEARKELEDLGYESEGYGILPIHPWQFKNELPLIYKKEVDEGTVVLLQETRMAAEATSSFRTVAPKLEGTPVLKLAVNSQMTSTVRSISPQTALNSTVFTSMVASIMQKETQLASFAPLNEWAGAAFQSSDVLKSRNLTMLVRESIDKKLEEEEVAIAGMSLYAESPVSGQTVFHDIIDVFSEAGGWNRTEAAYRFFNDYVKTVIPGYLTLMVKYGIALEGHLQNSIPVFRNGRLSRFFFRDWGGARIYTDRLRKQGLSPKFAADSVSVTNKRSDMHNKLYYTVFQNHLGELIRQLVQYSGTEEWVYWEVVKSVCHDVLDQLAEQKDIAAQVEEDRAFLFQPFVMHKSLTSMRLTDLRGYGYNKVPNPLA